MYSINFYLFQIWGLILCERGILRQDDRTKRRGWCVGLTHPAWRLWLCGDDCLAQSVSYTLSFFAQVDLPKDDDRGGGYIWKI